MTNENVSLTRTVNYGTFNRRLLASTIDSVLLLLITIPVTFVANIIIYKGRTPEIIMYELSEKYGQDVSPEMLMATLSQEGYWTSFFLVNILTLLVCSIAIGISWSKLGATPGKILFQLKIVDEKTHNPITNTQMLKRLFGYVLSTIPLCLGFMAVAWDKKRQGWHDKIAGTIVIVDENDFSLMDRYLAFKEKVTQRTKG